MPLVISTRALGQRRPLLADFTVPPPGEVGGGDEIRLRDLIVFVVRQDVDAFSKRQESNRFDRVLSARDIEKGSAQGKVDPAAKSLRQSIDVEEAVASALLAFEDGLYLVIIDEIERRHLDEPVRLTPDSHLTFVRLTFLAGA